MEDGKDNSAKLSKSKQPVKTEWGAQYVVFTYFQGDINSVVDEHFSRALSATKIPQDLSRKTGSEEAIVKNGTETHMSPQAWNFSPHWAKPYPASLPLNLSGSGENTAAAAPAIEPCPSSVLQGIPPTMAELWHMSSAGNPNLTAVSGYPPSGPDPHMAQGHTADGKYGGSLLGLLHQEGCPGSEQAPSASGSTCLTGSGRLQNTRQSLTSAGGIPVNDRRRALFF